MNSQLQASSAHLKSESEKRYVITSQDDYVIGDMGSNTVTGSSQASNYVHVNAC